ncbi:MAG: hypothetical protein PHO33_02255 [Clostridia bacterium]|nr:hypothetical protein [Clostridia bacterium]
MEYEIIENNDYKINYPTSLKDFVTSIIEYSIDKKQYFCSIFNVKMYDLPQINVSIFTNFNEFENYIKEVSHGATPPKWATGCFYNNEIQILVNLNSAYSMSSKFYTLAHETLHLFFNNFIYKKYNINRFRWLDESYACFLDGHIADMPTEKFNNIITKLNNITDNFNINQLNNMNKSQTNNYNSYDIFLVVGKYIFDNCLEKKYLDMIKTDCNMISQIGEHILKDAVDYYKNEQTNFMETKM